MKILGHFNIHALGKGISSLRIGLEPSIHEEITSTLLYFYTIQHYAERFITYVTVLFHIRRSLKKKTAKVILSLVWRAVALDAGHSGIAAARVATCFGPHFGSACVQFLLDLKGKLRV